MIHAAVLALAMLGQQCPGGQCRPQILPEKPVRSVLVKNEEGTAACQVAASIAKRIIRRPLLFRRLRSR